MPQAVTPAGPVAGVAGGTRPGRWQPTGGDAVPSPFYLAVRGRLLVAGKEPDGDSVRFLPHDRDAYRALQRGGGIRPARDGTVQLRLEGVDAPELRYSGASQPLGAQARDALLAALGFAHLEFDPVQPQRVVHAEPASVPAMILCQPLAISGRPIAYLTVDPEAVDGLRPGRLLVDQALLERTVNLRLLREGVAYYTAYASTPPGHHRHLRAAAAGAREARLGVWARDASAGFALDGRHSIDQQGQLVLPKLFRRCTDYLTDVAAGFPGSLTDWLTRQPATTRNRDDHLVIRYIRPARLSDLVVHRDGRVAFQADPLDLAFGSTTGRDSA
jgi:endonuclease YncB( thermonuclease family)